MASCAVV